MSLVKKYEPEGKWCPVSVANLDDFLLKVIYQGRGYKHVYALRRNIAYSLQHLEFLDRCVQDIKLTQVLTTQTWKTMIIVGCGVIESLLHFLLVARNLHSISDWELLAIAGGNSKKIEGEFRKIDSHLFKKLPSPVATQMTFDTMIKKSSSNKVLGRNKKLYEDLDKLRPLRNRVHLQAIDAPTDTDWNSFNFDEICCMMKILNEVLTSSIFHPSREEQAFFDYMARYQTTQ